MADSFLQTLEKVSIQDNTPAAKNILLEFCRAIRDFTQHKLECGAKEGFLVNMGQEYRVVVKPVGRDFEQILLRAYIPFTGFPTILDIYDDELISCRDAEELRTQLDAFLQRKQIIETILFLKKQAD